MMLKEVMLILRNNESILGFSVSEDAANVLRQIKERVGIIAVAGKYRTGKSFLLNRILLDKRDGSGFGVGPTINPYTKVSKYHSPINGLYHNLVGSPNLEQASRTPKTRRATPESICDRQRRNRGIQ
jgi:hypothetical protein